MSRVHAVLAIASAVLGLAAAGVDLRAGARAARLGSAIDAAGDYISAPDLANRIVGGDAAVRVVDLRSRAEYDQFHVASAIHSTLEDLVDAPLPLDATVVLYGDGGAEAARGWLLLRAAGHRRVLVLRDGLYEWIGRVLEPRLANDATAAERADFARATEMSRFFGGVPVAGVPRAEVPIGYWTDANQSQKQGAGRTRRAIASIRRRGC